MPATLAPASASWSGSRGAQVIRFQRAETKCGVCESAPNPATRMLAAMLAHVGQLGLWGARGMIPVYGRTRRRVARYTLVGIPFTARCTQLHTVQSRRVAFITSLIQRPRFFHFTLPALLKLRLTRRFFLSTPLSTVRPYHWKDSSESDRQTGLAEAAFASSSTFLGVSSAGGVLEARAPLCAPAQRARHGFTPLMSEPTSQQQLPNRRSAVSDA